MFIVACVEICITFELSFYLCCIFSLLRFIFPSFDVGAFLLDLCLSYFEFYSIRCLLLRGNSPSSELELVQFCVFLLLIVSLRFCGRIQLLASHFILEICLVSLSFFLQVLSCFGPSNDILSMILNWFILIDSKDCFNPPKCFLILNQIPSLLALHLHHISYENLACSWASLYTLSIFLCQEWTCALCSRNVARCASSQSNFDALS